MAAKRSKGFCYLDRVRVSRGVDACRADFRNICSTDRNKASYLINDNRLSFPGLFVLSDEIESFQLFETLRPRPVIALQIIREALQRPHPADEAYLSQRDEKVRPVLQWMMKTGANEDGTDDDYERVLDVAVSVLINLYHDQGVLPLAVELMFSRNKKGRTMHDLAWAVFQSRDHFVLKLIAQRIRSSEEKDAALACNLLSMGDAGDRQGQYDSALLWLEENERYLYFTGESFQLTSNPVFVRVDMESKYLQSAPRAGESVETAAEAFSASRRAFSSLNTVEKTVLSGYSHRLHKKDVQAWRRWMQLPIGEQMVNALSAKEDMR